MVQGISRTLSNAVTSTGHAAVNFAKKVGHVALMDRVKPAALPQFHLNPFSCEFTGKVYHAADKHGFATTLYKVAILVSMFLPLLAVLDFTVGNALRFTAGNLVTLAKRLHISHLNKTESYKLSPVKIGLLSALILGVAAYKYGFWPFGSSEASKVETPIVETPKEAPKEAPIEAGSSLPLIGGIVGGLVGLGGIALACKKWCASRTTAKGATGGASNTDTEHLNKKEANKDEKKEERKA
jgi:hypothetical protein